MIRPIEPDQTLDERFSDAWSHHGDGPAPSAADFLANYPDASPAERLDVLLADQLLRWRRDCPKSVGEYLAEHPGLASDSEAILKLVQGEFLARLERADVPDPGSYARMFPELAEEIRQQCEVDQWLTISLPSGPSMATTVDYGASDADEDAPAIDRTNDGSRRPSLGPPGDQDAPLPEADFQPTRLLGSGGMGEVYEAIQKSLRKPVALKLIKREALDSPSRVRRFFAEARALARLRHPHIVGVHGIGRMTDGRYFLVMDLVEGGTTLADRIKAGSVPFDRAAALVATVAEAIEHAHSRSVIHRDLKPSNVLLDAEGNPHVTDFGLAKVFDAADPDHPQTTADQILGTPHYMAPEQGDPARGPITPRTDVYALGGLLYALLTGKPPIQGDSITALLTQVVSPEPVRSPRELRADIPAALEGICRTCLEKHPDRRYASAVAVAAALRSWLANPDREPVAGVGAGITEGSTVSGKGPGTGGSRQDWISDRSWKVGRRTPNAGRWAARSSPEAWSHRRRVWTVGAWASTLAVLGIVMAVLQYRPQERVRVEVTQLAKGPVPPGPAPSSSQGEPGIRPSRLELAPELKKRGDAPPLVAPIPQPADPIAGWDVHAFHPEPDGKSWLDLGNALETGRGIQTGDRVKLKASFRAAVYAAVLAINPDGSVQRLAAPAKGSPDQPATELTIPTRVDRYIRLTDRGPTAFVLLVSRQPLADPAGVVTSALDADGWQAGRVENLWTFDGQVAAPFLRKRVAEEAVGPQAFAMLCERLKGRAELAAVRAVVFDVQ